MSMKRDNDGSHLKDKVLLITGCTDGIGLALIETIFGANSILNSEDMPKKIIMVARNIEKAKGGPVALISSQVPYSLYQADLSSPKEMYKVIAKIHQTEPSIDIMVLNAGIWHMGDKKIKYQDRPRMVQEDNLELHYTTNFLHMALFIQELGINNNKMSDGGRIIVTGSFTAWTMAKGALNLQDFGTPEGPTFCVNFGMGYTYSQSKLAQHMYVKHLTNSGNTGAETRMGLHDSITVNIVCPGAVVTNVDVIQHVKELVGCCFGCIKTCGGFRDPREGAKVLYHAVGSEEMAGVSGKFLNFGQMGACAYQPPNEPDYYPHLKDTEVTKTAKDIGNNEKCKQLYESTGVRLAELRKKYYKTYEGNRQERLGVVVDSDNEEEEEGGEEGNAGEVDAMVGKR